MRDQLSLYVSEKEELVQTLEIAQKDLEILMSKDSGGGGGEGEISMEAFKRMERERDDLRKVIEDQVCKIHTLTFSLTHTHTHTLTHMHTHTHTHSHTHRRSKPQR